MSQVSSLFQGKKFKQLEDEVAEFHALQKEIDKARCVVEYSPSGNFLSVNHNWLRALGYQSNEMIGKNHFDFITQNDKATPQLQGLWERLSKGQNDTGQYRFVAKNGQVHWFQGYFSPIPNAKGEIYKVTSYMTDITEERNKAITLQGEDEALNKSFGVLECDIKGTIVDCNQLFLDQIGYKKNELLGKNVSLLIPSEVANSPEYKAMWVSLSQGDMQVRQIKRIAKSGEELWFQSNYVPIRDEDGSVNKVISYSVCITAEKKRNAEYEGQINAINRTQAVIEFDLSGTILKVNQNFCDTVGYAADEILGKHHSMFVAQDERVSQAYQDFWHNLSLGKPDANVIKRLGKNGKEIWLQASYNPILDANGKVSKVVKYATDITTKKLEDADNQGQIESINRALGVIEFSLDGTINRVNHIFSELTGYSESEILGHHHSMFVDEAYKNGNEYKQLWNHLKAGKFESGVFKRYGKGGKQIWLQATYNPILDADGKPFKVVKFAIDVTEQHDSAQILSDAVSETQEVIEAAKLGDLSNRVSLAGKTGAIASLCDGVNALMDKMTEVIIQVKEAGETINTAAGEISSGNNDLSSRTEQQASSLEETA
ncbi:MAG: chemotaxis protein, partial [Methylotenera sp.]|uniref:PAS domain-containing protein n=1 Tax=Methylotenera sp. TaxID=2051956 RepID=UPI000D4DD52D